MQISVEIWQIIFMDREPRFAVVSFTAHNASSSLAELDVNEGVLSAVLLEEPKRFVDEVAHVGSFPAIDHVPSREEVSC